MDTTDPLKKTASSDEALPNRVLFNPGTENPEFYKLLDQASIRYEIACTLVLLSTNQY